MIMSGSHIPDGTLEPSQIRVYEIRVLAHHSPLNIILSNASSSWKDSNLGEVSPNTYFPHLSVDMHQPLYLDLFLEGSTLVIVSDIFDYFPTNTVCERIQSDDVLQSHIWEGSNHLTSPLLETLSIDSIHYWESKESDMLNCQPINI